MEFKETEFEEIEFEEINNVEPLDTKNYLLPNNLPIFIKKIINSETLSENVKNDFMAFFGIRYLEDEHFRSLLPKSNFKILFMNNKYLGIIRDNIEIFEVNGINKIKEKVERKIINKIPKMSLEELEIKKLKLFKETKENNLKYNHLSSNHEGHENLNANKNILILCADDKSFVKNKWTEFLSKIIYTNEYNPYFLGENLFEKLPYRINGKLDDIKNLNFLNDIKFDAIFLEFCPNFILNYKIQKIIYNLLTENGIIISPNYSNLKFGLFEKLIRVEKEDFLIFSK